MTKRHYKKMAALFAPKPVYADARYGLHALDSTREELMPSEIRRTAKGDEVWLPTRSGGRKPMLASRRDSEPGDPWLSPVPNKKSESRSDALTALLIQIAHAERNSLPLQNTGTADNYEYDLRDFCAMASLTERQAEVVLMVGEGSTVTQIAAELGISHQAVSIRLHKGRRRLIQAVLPLDPISHLPKAESLRKVYSIGGGTRPVPA